MSNSDKQKHLLVPINVEALLVGKAVAKPGEGWSNLSPDFSRLWEGDILGGQLSPSLKTFNDRPHSPGVHLHWALPDALTHGRQARGKDGAEPTVPPEFPYIPNRWMVQRLIHPAQGNEVRVRAWVIESDYLYGEDETPQAQCVTVPRLQAFPLYAHAGRQFDYEAWREGADTAYKFQLTALGHGDPAFAAFYPACKSLLGFHDSLEDVADGSRLSYLVAGWYSDPTRDPLRSTGEPNTPAQWLARLETLKWATDQSYPLSRTQAGEKLMIISDHGDLSARFPEGAVFQVLDDVGNSAEYRVTGSSFEEPEFRLQVDPAPREQAGGVIAPPGMECPDLTLCHGFICGIQWRGKDAVYPSRVPGLNRDNCRVAVGMSSAEALAALLSENMDDAKAQTLLSAFQADILTHEGDEREVRSLLHQNRFRSSDGGRRLAIRKESDSELRKTAEEDATLSGEVLGLLDELNGELERRGRRRRGLAATRWELFATWYKLTRIKLDNPDDPRIATLNQQIDVLKQEIEDDEQALAGPTRVEFGRWALDSAIDAKFTALHTQDAPEPPFWQPRDPAVLVASEATRVSRRHGHDGRYSKKDQLRCRISGRESTAMLVDIPNNRRGVRVDAGQAFEIRRDGAGGGPVPMGVTDALLLECLLLDPASVRRIAEQAYVAAGLSSRPGEKELLAAVETMLDLEGKASGSGARSAGILPSPIARQIWRANPWLPLLLKWRLAWHSSFDRLPDALAGWSLSGDGGDYRFDGAVPDTKGETLYQGYNILTPHALERFGDALAAHNEDAGDPALDKMLTRLDGLNILSQVLGGLGEAFRMRDTVLQLPPIKLPPKPEQIIDPIAAMLGDAADSSPDPDKSFFPIRAGHAELIDLAIVDAFGQTLQVPGECLEAPLRADAMAVAGEQAASYLAFPPRVAQPLRLRFDWTPADNPPDFPLNSPVCGWVMPNHLDKSLLFFDAAGNAHGALQKILRLSVAAAGGAVQDDLEAFFWVPRPGSDLQPGDIHNPQLRGLIQFLLAMGADTGDAFWQRLDQALGKMDSGVPEDDPLTSVLVGRPLVLARLDLALELAGLPDLDQSLEQAGKFETGGFERVRFPLLFGDALGDGDGLVGYFRDREQSGEALGPLYPAAGSPGPTVAGSLAGDGPLDIDCSTAASLTLLMDPLSRVHARTGILPRTYCELPQRWRSAARTVKTAFFQAAPLISPGGDLRLPKPSDDFGKWSWACRPEVTGWQEYTPIEPLGDRAGFPPVRQELQEGWLQLRLNPLAILKFAVREGGPEVLAGTNITLRWLLKGGARLELFDGADEKTWRVLEQWTTPFPEQHRLPVDADTTYTLRLSDDDGNREQKQLTMNIRKVGKD